MPVCRTSALPGQQALLELSWRTDNDILAGRNVASQIYNRIVLLYPDLAQVQCADCSTNDYLAACRALRLRVEDALLIVCLDAAS